MTKIGTNSQQRESKNEVISHGVFVKALLFIRLVSRRWTDHGNSIAAAAISFYALFAIAPLTIFSLIVAGKLIGAERAQDVAESQLGSILGARGVEALNSVVTQAGKFNTEMTLATGMTVVLLLYGASYVFALLRKALDRILGFDEHALSAKRSLLGALLRRSIAIGFVVIAGTLITSLLVGSVFLNWVITDLVNLSGVPDFVWQTSAIGFSFLLTASIFAATFTLLPSRRPSFKVVLVAVLITAPLFESGKWIFTTFVSRSVVASIYGSAGSLVALLIWVYYSTRIVLLAFELAAGWQDLKSKPPIE